MSGALSDVPAPGSLTGGEPTRSDIIPEDFAVSVLAEALSLSRLVQDDASWRMLRADNAPVIMALMAAQSGGE